MSQSDFIEPWHIAGPGAIGLLLHSKLQQATESHLFPIMIHRSHQPAYDNYQVIDQDSTSLYPIHWFNQEQVIHNLIITTKSYQVLDCITQLIPFLATEANIVLLHNGLGIQQTAVKRWPTFNFFAGSTTEGAWKSEENKVIYAGQGETLIGSMTSNECLWWEKSSLSKAGVHWQENIMTQLHTKVAINAAINPLTILFECQNGDLLTSENRFSLMKTLCQETQTVLTKEGYPIDTLVDIVTQVAQRTGANFSSSYQDWQHNRQTELSSMNGYIQSLAKKHKINTPVHDKVMEEVSLKALI